MMVVSDRFEPLHFLNKIFSYILKKDVTDYYFLLYITHIICKVKMLWLNQQQKDVVYLKYNIS